jgi:DNA modification methylase
MLTLPLIMSGTDFTRYFTWITYYTPYIEQVSLKNGVPAALSKAIAFSESKFDSNATDSLYLLKIKSKKKPSHSIFQIQAGPWNPFASIKAGIKIFKNKLVYFKNDTMFAIMAYNLGNTGAKNYWNKFHRYSKYAKRIHHLSEEFQRIENNKRIENSKKLFMNNQSSVNSRQSIVENNSLNTKNLILNTIYHGDSLEVLRNLPDESIDCCITSPPYWGLRDYGTGSWEGGDPECKHTISRESSGLNNYGAHSRDSFAGMEFCKKCGAKRIDKQLGLEKTPEEYIEKMVEIFREVKRTLKKHGTLWLNMGDSYVSGKSRYSSKEQTLAGKSRNEPLNNNRPDLIGHEFFKDKDLSGIPWRLAFALQADGWYLRQDIIWHKPNPMPESVSGSRWERHKVKVVGGRESVVGEEKSDSRLPITDSRLQDCPGCEKCEANDGYVLRMSAGRCTKNHEYIFLLSKSPSYYYDSEAIKEKAIDLENIKGLTKRNPVMMMKYDAKHYGFSNRVNLEGKTYPKCNKRSVWTINTHGFKDAHFATFPVKLIVPMIKAGTSEKGYCSKCGKPVVRIVEPSEEYNKLLGTGFTDHKNDSTQGMSQTKKKPSYNSEYNTLGWRASCKCGAETVPGVVLDPFMGSGTVADVARRLNRNYVGIELKEEYIKMAERRLHRLF